MLNQHFYLKKMLITSKYMPKFRVDKHWFVVRDGSVKTERLLTLVPKNPKSVLECTPDTRRTILDLFLTLQHPYIYPVLDVEFVEGATDPETTFITLVLPFNSKGSLKDLIYKVYLCYNIFINKILKKYRSQKFNKL